MSKISDHITLAEATKSQTAVRLGIDNLPNKEQLEAMKHVATKVFEPLRKAMGNKSIAITSFFRGEELNAAIKGSKSSQHCKGEAMDIDADVFGGLKNSDIFKYILNHLEYDQLIAEYKSGNEPAWIHVSLKKNGQNRKEVLIATKDRGYLLYTEEMYKKIYG